MQDCKFVTNKLKSVVYDSSCILHMKIWDKIYHNYDQRFIYTTYHMVDTCNCFGYRSHHRGLDRWEQCAYTDGGISLVCQLIIFNTTDYYNLHVV